MTYRDLIRLLKDDGWYADHQTGSHIIFRHPTKPGSVVLTGGGKAARDVPPGTANAILRQAGLKGGPP